MTWIGEEQIMYIKDGPVSSCCPGLQSCTQQWRVLAADWSVVACYSSARFPRLLPVSLLSTKMPFASRSTLNCAKMQTKMSTWTPLNHQLSNNNVNILSLHQSSLIICIMHVNICLAVTVLHAGVWREEKLVEKVGKWLPPEMYARQSADKVMNVVNQTSTSQPTTPISNQTAMVCTVTLLLGVQSPCKYPISEHPSERSDCCLTVVCLSLTSGLTARGRPFCRTSSPGVLWSSWGSCAGVWVSR